MRNIATIFKREFLAYFNSPIAYIVVIVFLAINSFIFSLGFFDINVAEMRSFFGVLPWTLAVFMPALTMKMWAEERRSGTIGLLLSLPAKNYELVVGKFKASMGLYLVMLFGTLTIPLMVALAGDPDFGPIIGGYIGAIFIGAFFIAVGLFTSVLFKDQILALIVAIVLCFAFYLLGTNIVAAHIDGWTGGLGTFLKGALGVAERVSSIERGVLDIGDIFFFVILTAAFLVLNVYAIESRIRMHGASLFPAGVALVIAIAAALNVVISEVRMPRLDLTEAGEYSLTPATKRILSKLKAPVKVRYYITPKDRMPTLMKNLERDVRDKLDEFGRYSEMFAYDVIDPTLDVETREKLQGQGIVPFVARHFEQDSRETKLVYSTIAITYLDKKEEIIPQVVPNRLGQLEYELISRIYRMTLESKPAVAVYSPLRYPDPRMREESFRKLMAQMGRPVPPPEDNFRAVKEMLKKEGYEVSAVDLEGEGKIPDEAKTLLVLGPEKLKPEYLKKIENFIGRGGNLFIAVQNYNYSYSPAPQGGMVVTPAKLESGIEPLLRKMGLGIEKGMLLDQSVEQITMQVTRQMGGMVYRGPEVVSTPVQVLVKTDSMKQDTGITDRLSALTYIWGSALTMDEKVIEKAGLEAKVLFTSSASSWSIPDKATPLTNEDMNPDIHKEKKAKLLAVMLKGTPPGASDKSVTFGAVVAGCSEMFNDNVIGWRSNAIFLLNSIDTLTLEENLASIRSKGGGVKMLHEMSAGKKLFYRFLTLGLVPILFAALGIVRSVLRKRRRAAHLRKFA